MRNEKVLCALVGWGMYYDIVRTWGGLNMKIIVTVALWFALVCIVTPASADPEAGRIFNSIGANFGIDHVFGIQTEFGVSVLTDDQRWTGQAFLKNFSDKTSPGVSWNVTAIGAAAIYAFQAVSGPADDIRPYAGVGLAYENYNWSGNGRSRRYAGTKEWAYLVAGARYPLASQVDGDVNFNTLGDLTVGVNYNF